MPTDLSFWAGVILVISFPSISICPEKIFCLAHGQLLAEGSPEQIKNDKRVINAYLGAQ